MNKKYIIVTDEEQYEALENHINEHDYHAVDSETTGLNPRKHEVIGVSICGKVGESFYLPYKTWNKETNQLENIWEESRFKHIVRLLMDKELLMWNGSFDTRMIRHSLGIDLTMSLFAEVILLKHTIQEDAFFQLKRTAIELQHELGLDIEEEANKEQIVLKANVLANGGQWTKDNKDMYMADLDVMGPYACADADLTLRIGEYYSNKLAEENLNNFYYDDEVMPLYKEVTIPMEDNGVLLDLDLINRTNSSLVKDMEKLHKEIIDDLLDQESVQEWLYFTAKDRFPARKSGNFGQRIVDHYGLDFPRSEKTGKYLINKKAVASLEEGPIKNFLLGDNEALDPRDVAEIQKQLWYDQEGAYVNISSKHQMGQIVFDYMKIKPIGKTDSGKPQFDDSMIQNLVEKHKISWAHKLSNYNKLVKIKGTYIDRFLDNHFEGRYYFQYKQHGTVSGRYGSDAQQLPRPKEEGELDELVLKYNNIIRNFFIAEEGRVFIDSDYESLEPHVFAHVSNDEGLRNIFRKGHDFYSTIAIATEKIAEVSADKKAENYLGKVMKAVRQAAKAYSLGVPYGMTAFALGKTLDISTKEAQILIDGYLNGFPELKQWMKDSEEFVKQFGYIKIETGRIRHLPKVKELHRKFGKKLLDFRYRKSIEKRFGKDQVYKWYMDYKNGLNNAKNIQIQGLSASIVNRAAIAVTRAFKEVGIDGYVCAQIHDQLIFNVPIERKEEAMEIVQSCMENNYTLSLKLKAPPEFAVNFNEGH